MAVERQLELHLEEQKETLCAVKEALSSDPFNSELIGVHEELQFAIKDAEEGLLHLKRSRLLKEADSIFVGQEPGIIMEDVNAELLDHKNSLRESTATEIYSVGSKCRFRHTDGHWYNGYIVALEGANTARISFLTPTSENMLICKFFLQQRCRFGNKCRMSHGFSFPFSSLKPYVPTEWRPSLVGSTIWAISSDHSKVWRRAELESWDGELCVGQIVFQDDGSTAKLGAEALSISEYADAVDDDEDNDDADNSFTEESSSLSDEEDVDDESIHQGIGYLEASSIQRGVQTETAVFAKWEHHTRGIASKMMASMGYREGMGLGATGQGMVDPVSVRILPARQSLDHALASGDGHEQNSSSRRGKKRSRGGRRKQEKKIAEAARAAKAEEEEESDVFSFINNQLAAQGAASKGNRVNKGLGDLEGKAKVEDRRSLVAYEEEMKDLRTRVEKLEEMVNRNRKDKTVFEAASRKLSETRKALADAEAAHASASNAVVSKEKEKRWLKF
ncbi:hypothetical protein HPP92_010508 [Vanilla planifolia]|uniref:Zinc finger CCCH domain-containing protein 18 n=1 Tax=Vanilla planifolia TaxID=51239 RepID=A0A835V054_VANPL|nr:hypothetical protein HPP92_010508 [Vanilla planifolia]